MARRGRTRSNPGSSADTIDNASLDLDGLLEPLPALPVDPVSNVDDFLGPSIPYDQRAFSLSQEVAHVEPNRGRTILAPEESRGAGIPSGDPRRTSICVRRNERREVLHALNRTRKRGRGGQRNRTWRSDVKC